MYGSRTMNRVAVALSSAIMLLGLILICLTIAGGGSLLARGVFIGFVFIAVGALRLWIAVRG